LAEHILTRLCNDTDQEKTRLMPGALATLEAYHFPGNVRELENILKRAMALCEDYRITVNNIVFPSRQQNRASVPAGRPVSVAVES
jgi:two-component system response regulator PilR (NtrC family)